LRPPLSNNLSSVELGTASYSGAYLTMHSFYDDASAVAQRIDFTHASPLVSVPSSGLPSLSPDGQVLAAVQTSRRTIFSEGEVYLFNLDDGGSVAPMMTQPNRSTRFANSSVQLPVFSFDGSRFAFETNEDGWALDDDGGTAGALRIVIGPRQSDGGVRQ